jgi:hypothetical protein
MFLTPDEVRQLTGRTRPSAQIIQLEVQGIKFITDADGKPIVVRNDIGATMEPARAQRRAIKPNWEALDAKTP